MHDTGLRVRQSLPSHVIGKQYGKEGKPGLVFGRGESVARKKAE